MPRAQKKTYSIAEFAKLAGVYKDTVRNYQKKGLLPDRRNPANNYRVFYPEDLSKLLQLSRGVVTDKK